MDLQEQIQELENRAKEKIAEIELEKNICIDNLQKWDSIKDKLSAKLRSIHLKPENKNFLSRTNILSLSLKADDKFIFIKDRGYNNQGSGKNQITLDNKAKKLSSKIEEIGGIKVSVNPFSLEEGGDIVLLDIRFI